MTEQVTADDSSIDSAASGLSAGLGAAVLPAPTFERGDKA